MDTKGWGNEEFVGQLEIAYAEECDTATWEIEKDSVTKALQSLETALSDRYGLKGVLGVGGSGIVLRLSDALFPDLDSALKFPRPVKGKTDLISEMLDKEIGHLSRLRHPSIVPMHFYSKLEKVGDYSSLPFYLMSAIDGRSSAKYVKEGISENQLVALIASIVECVAYIHNHPLGKLAHLDLKPDNVVVDADGRPVMIDLGTCKLVDYDKEKTIIATTKGRAHPELVSALARDPSDENRAKGHLSRDSIKLKWDMHALGNAVLSWTGLDYLTGQIVAENTYRGLSAYKRKYILLFASRLLADSPPAWLSKMIGLDTILLRDFYIDNANLALDVILRIDGAKGPVPELPELQLPNSGTIQAASRQHVVSSERLNAVLKHPLFKRLNHISQLGLVSHVYPGAGHARREHSLGTYANTGRFLRALWSDPSSPLFRQIVSERDCRTVLLAALLHDLGQYPMAHDFEDIFPNHFSHTVLTQVMISGKWDKKRPKWTKIEFPSLEEVLKIWDVNRDDLIGLLKAKPGSVEPRMWKLLRAIISGPIDADKLDYLFRDAKHLGLTYPQGIDVDMLLKSLTVVFHNKVRQSNWVPAIGILSKGKITAESLTFARYAMFNRAYWHHAVRVQKAMLSRAVYALFDRLADETNINAFLSRFFAFVSELPMSIHKVAVKGADDNLLMPRGQRQFHASDSFKSELNMLDAATLAWIENEVNRAGLPEGQLIQDIISRNLFKRLWTISEEVEANTWNRLTRAWDGVKAEHRIRLHRNFELAVFQELQLNGIQDVTRIMAEDALGWLEEMLASKIPWLLIDIPGARSGSGVPLVCVSDGLSRSLRKDPRIIGATQRSLLWESYARDLRKTAGKFRIFCDPQVVDTIEESIVIEKAMELLFQEMESLHAL